MRFTAWSRELLVELTPMIDVVFLLIIFFMVTAEFARNVRAEVELPKLPGEQSQQTEEAGVVINIDAEGQIILEVSDAPVPIGSCRIDCWRSSRPSPVSSLECCCELTGRHRPRD